MSHVYTSKVCFKMWILLFLVFFFYPVKGFKTTCNIPPVMPGSNASLTCHFTENINQTGRNFTVFGPDRAIAVKCIWNDTKLKCNNGSGFDDYNFQVSDIFSIEFPQVSKNQYGYYECKLNKRVFTEACFLEEKTRLRLTCPNYPGDVITAPAGSVIHVKFCFEGLDDDQESYRFKVLIVKNVTEDSLHKDLEIVCDVNYNRKKKAFVSSYDQRCLNASGSSSLVLTMYVSRQNNGQGISLETYRSGIFTSPTKYLLLNITKTLEIVINDRKAVIVSKSEQVRLEYQLRTHVDKLSCRLQMLATGHEIVRHENTFTCFLVGQPPDMNLTLVINNITATDSGLWKLEIENELGMDSVEFLVHVRDVLFEFTENAFNNVKVSCCIAVVVALICWSLEDVFFQSTTTTRLPVKPQWFSEGLQWLSQQSLQE